MSPNYVINKISNFKFSLTQNVVLTDLSLAFRKFVCCSVFFIWKTCLTLDLSSFTLFIPILQDVSV